jgi:hypothetical protein
MEDNFINSRFIYFKENSITSDLLIDILNIFNENVHNKVNNNITYTFTHGDIEYNRVKNFLMNELHRNMVIYLNNINTKIGNNFTISIRDLFMAKNTFTIQKTITTNELYDKNNVINIINKNIKQKFMYIWFLSDYDGEFIIHNCKIKPNAGALLIFPCSWCFPYYEDIAFNSVKYYIFGYVYDKDDGY